MGSKNRIAKYLLPIMLEEAKKNNITTWVEPFVGGANMIDKVPKYFNRIGYDINKYLISFFNEIQKGWLPPDNITLEQYKYIKQNKDKDFKMTLWAGIGCSYCGKWFGGYASDYPESRRLKNGKLPNFQIEVRNGLLKQLPLIKNVEFICDSFENLSFENSLIYCDPPYKGTTKYKDDFNHELFYKWCKEMKSKGNLVFISEYEMPNEFKCILEVETNTQLGNGSKSGNKKAIEKLFTL